MSFYDICQDIKCDAFVLPSIGFLWYTLYQINCFNNIIKPLLTSIPMEPKKYGNHTAVFTLVVAVITCPLLWLQAESRRFISDSKNN